MANFNGQKVIQAFNYGMNVVKGFGGDLFTRKNPIGDHNIINTATPEKMMVIKKNYYPDNSILTVSGDVKH